MRKLTELLAFVAMLGLVGAFAAPATADSDHITTEWAEGVPFDGGPSCDVNDDGDDDSYYNALIPFEYRLIGNLVGDEFVGQYVMRFTDAPYTSVEPPAGWPAVILVTGQVRNIGTIMSDDFADPAELQPLSVLTLRWNYRITDVDGNHLASTGGRIELDPASSGPPVILGSYGPCTEP